MKEGGGSPGRRVVGSLQAEWREREKITFNFSRSFHGRHHRHTGGRGRGGCTLQQKQARTVCAWVPLRARHSKNPKPVLFFFVSPTRGSKNPATGSGEEPERFRIFIFISSERNRKNSTRFDSRSGIYSPRSHACNSRSTVPIHNFRIRPPRAPHMAPSARVPDSIQFTFHRFARTFVISSPPASRSGYFEGLRNRIIPWCSGQSQISLGYRIWRCNLWTWIKLCPGLVFFRS